MKYIVCNLKSSLTDNNVYDYINEIKNINYSKLIICPNKKYIDLFNGNYSVGSQDYYENINVKYNIIGHYEKKESYEVIKEKILKSLKDNKKVIFCIGNNNFDDIKSLDKQLDLLNDINYSNNIIVAYEPFFMIGSNNDINIDKIQKNILYIKEKTNNLKVLYGGNVNKNNIENLLKISDGILIARFSYDPHNITNIFNTLKKLL